jgi:hypothetical protein
VAFCVANPLKLPFLVSDKIRAEMVVVPCVLCGCAGTMTVSSAKAVFNSLKQAFSGNPAMFARLDICWLTYLIIVVAVFSIVGQVKYLNEALMRHGASRVVPVCTQLPRCMHACMQSPSTSVLGHSLRSMPTDRG